MAIDLNLQKPLRKEVRKIPRSCSCGREDVGTVEADVKGQGR
jgi:hypothetical protein